VEIEFHAYFDSIPHAKRLKLLRLRIADGRMLQWSKQSLKVGGSSGGKSPPTTVGVPQGSPLSPFYSNIYLNLMDQLWHKRGSPDKVGATLHRYAADAILVCRHSAYPARDAFTALAQRRGLTRNRDKTRSTKRTEGCDFLGFHLVKRQSPPSGKQAIYIFPAKTSQPKIRKRLKYLPSRRAPITPQAVVEVVKHTVTGGVNYSRHTNASEAFRGLQRCMNIRCRRYLTLRRKGRGFGGKRSPHSTRYAMGLPYIGSGLIEYAPKPAQGVRGRLSDRRTRENCTDGGMGRGW